MSHNGYNYPLNAGQSQQNQGYCTSDQSYPVYSNSDGYQPMHNHHHYQHDNRIGHQPAYAYHNPPMYTQHRQNPSSQFSFNVNAQEFRPSRDNFQLNHTQHYSQQQYMAYPPNDHCSIPYHPQPQMQQFYQNQTYDAFALFGQQSQQYAPSEQLMHDMSKSNAYDLLNEILVGCEQLLAEGEDDAVTWTKAIQDRFLDEKMDKESKKVAVRLIIEMAYSMTPNKLQGIDPQYTFAVLIQRLERAIPNFFREVLANTLQEFHDQRPRLLNEQRVLLATFFAEIFVRVTLENGVRISAIGNALCEQLEDIVNFQANDDNMDGLLKIFKMSGAEIDYSSELKPRADQILTKMGAYARGSRQLTETTKAKILSLLETRQRGWGRAPVAPEATCAASYRVESDYETVLTDFTEDESNFMEDHLKALDTAEDDIDENEVMKDFGKFVLQENEELETSTLMEKLNVGDEKTENNEEKVENKKE